MRQRKRNWEIKKLEGGIHCLDCWKKVEKDYRWYATGIGGDVMKQMGWRAASNYYFDWKTNQWCSVDISEGTKFDPDVSISPNDKVPNYWVGCLKCDWERELKDNETYGMLIKCEKCHSNTEFYPANKRRNKNNRDDDKRDENDPEKRELEHLISAIQQSLKAFKQIPKNHPGYNEYQKQQLEKQLSEAKEKYRIRFGELPSSLREDVGGGGGGENPPSNGKGYVLWIVLVVILLIIAGIVVYYLLKKNKNKKSYE